MCDGSEFVESQPLHDGARWFRVLTNEDHVTRAGALHYQALKGSQFSASDAENIWDHELSGRALCLAGDSQAIIADGQARIASIEANFKAKNERMPSKIRFIGVATAEATVLRTVIGQAKLDTAYTPTNDVAHSDIVTFGTTSEDLDPIRYWLLKNLSIIPTSNIAALFINPAVTIA